MYYLCILYIVYVYLYRIHVQDINQYNMIGNVGVSCGQWPVYKARPVAGGRCRCDWHDKMKVVMIYDK